MEYRATWNEEFFLHPQHQFSIRSHQYIRIRLASLVPMTCQRCFTEFTIRISERPRLLFGTVYPISQGVSYVDRSCANVSKVLVIVFIWICKHIQSGVVGWLSGISLCITSIRCQVLDLHWLGQFGSNCWSLGNGKEHMCLHLCGDYYRRPLSDDYPSHPPEASWYDMTFSISSLHCMHS